MKTIVSAQEKKRPGQNQGRGKRAKGACDGATGSPAKRQKRTVSENKEDGEGAGGDSSAEAAGPENGLKLHTMETVGSGVRADETKI